MKKPQVLPLPSEVAISKDGTSVIFGFLIDGVPTSMSLTAKTLGEMLNRMQEAADEALKRRLDAGGHPDLEAIGKPNNPVQKMDLLPDVSGTIAFLSARGANGASVSLQLDMTLLQALHQALPGLIEEMNRRQVAAAKKQ